MDLKDKLTVAAIVIVAIIASALIAVYPVVAYTLFAVAGVFGIGFLCFRYKWFRITTIVLVYLGLIGGSIYCGYNIDQYYSARGGIFGYFSDLTNPNEVAVKEQSFDFSSIELKGQGDTYSAKITESYVLTLDDGKTFGVFVNDSPCTFVETAPDYVRADYVYEFLDSEMRPVLTDTLQFRFILGKNYTEFNVTTNGGAQAVKYWNSYFARNNFVVTIKQVDKSFFSDPELVDGQVEFALANYYIKNDLWLTQVYHLGDEVDFPFPEQITTSFRGWSTDGESVIEEYTINGDTNFYAVEGEEKMYTVVYKFKGKELKRERFLEGTQLTDSYTPSLTGYTFKGWKDADGQPFDFSACYIYSDLELQADFQADMQVISVHFVYRNDEDVLTRYSAARISKNGYGSIQGDLNSYRSDYEINIWSGQPLSLDMYMHELVEPVHDTTGSMVYTVTNYDSKNGTNKVTVGTWNKYPESERERLGWAYHGQVNIDNLNTGMDIWIEVKPIRYNIQFIYWVSGANNQVMGTARDLVIGEKPLLASHMTNEDKNACLTLNNAAFGGTFKGWHYYQTTTEVSELTLDTNLGWINALTPEDISHYSSGVRYPIMQYIDGVPTFQLYALFFK